MPFVYQFPTNVHGFYVESETLSVWSCGGFSYRSGCDGGYDIFLGHSEMLGKDVSSASAPIVGCVVVGLDGHIRAPEFIRNHNYENALGCYLDLFPERSVDAEKNDVLFFSDAVNIVDAAAYDCENDNYVFHYSFDDGDYVELSSKGIGVCRIFPSGVCVHKSTTKSRYEGCDSRLRQLWAIERKNLDSALCPVNITEGPLADTVLLNLGFVEDQTGNGCPNQVALVRQRSGEILWVVEFPRVVNSIWSDEKYVFISSQGSAYLLDPVSGDIVNRIDNVFGIESNQRYQQNKIYESVLKSLLVSDGEHLYFFNTSYLLDSKSHCNEFWIFDIQTLECLRHDHLPHGFTVDRNTDPRCFSGKLYVPMTRSFWGDEGGALVEFDPDDLHSDFVCDTEVGFDQSLRKNGNSEEYVLTTECSSLEDILRYGESQLKNMAISFGCCIFSKEVKNPNFNGMIHLAIRKNALQSKPNTSHETRLGMLVRRLNAWGKSGYYASDGKNFVSFDWEWV